MTKLQEKLVDKLKTVSKDNDFILGVLMDAETEEDQQTIIDYIDKGEDVNE